MHTQGGTWKIAYAGFPFFEWRLIMLSKSRVAVLVTGALLATGGVLAQSEDAASLDHSAEYEQLSVY